MADQTQRLEIATVRAEVGSNIVYRFANDAANEGAIPTDSGGIQNLKQVIIEIQEDAADKISIATTIYQTPAAGLAATADGGIFLVQSSDADTIYTVWKNQAGSAVNTGKTAMSSQAVQDALTASNEAAQAAEDAADVATNRTAGFLAPAAIAPATRENGLPLQEGDRYFNTEYQAEYLYKSGGWTPNDSIAAIESLEDSISVSPASDHIPRASETGKLDIGWLPDELVTQSELAPTVSLANDINLRTIQVQDYAALKAYDGAASTVRVMSEDLRGDFDSQGVQTGITETTGIILIGNDGRVWKRRDLSRLVVTWFGAVRGSADQLAAFNKAATFAKGISSSAGKVIIEVPEGEWFLSQPTTDDAIWYLKPNSEFSAVGGVAPTFVTDTRMLSGKVFRFGGAKQANTLTAGDSNYTVQKKLGKGITGELTGMSKNAAPGVTGVSHSSGSSSSGQSTIGVQGIAINDNFSVARHAWGAYLESFRLNGASGNATASEMMIYNGGDVKPSNVFLTPRDDSGQTYGIWITTGYDEQSAIDLGKDATGALGISKKGQARFNRGIVFYTDTITSKEAIVMPHDHLMKWVTSTGTGETIAEVPTAMFGASYYNQVTFGATCAIRSFRRNADGSDTAQNNILAITEAYGVSGGTNKLLVQTRAVQTSAFSGGNAAGRFDILVNSAAGVQSLISFTSSVIQFGTDLLGSIGTQAQRMADVFSARFRPGAGDVIWTAGAGTPEGAVAAPVGSLYTRTDGGTSTTLYVKESGTGNTGWKAK